MPLTDTVTTVEQLGISWHDFDVSAADADDFAALKQAIYDHRVVVLRGQQDMTPEEFIALGRGLGTIIPYYEPMYHHPEHSEIFVSSNVPVDGERVGVPKTGRFWHADYQFKEQPFSFTLFAPKIFPEGNRATYFVDMAAAFAALPDQLQEEARATKASHSVRRFFKIRPDDVFRPLGEIIDEVESVSPPAVHNTVITHPVTGEEILYVSEGFTDHLEGPAREGLLRELLEASGQLDPEYTHPLILRHAYEKGDVVIWDNRALVHRGLHVSGNGATMSHRITVVDDLPFDAREA